MRKTTLVSLIAAGAAGAIATSALAQEAVVPAPAPQAVPAPAEPAAQDPAAVPGPEVPGTTAVPATPGPEVAAEPAEPVTPPEPAPPPPPPPPTDPVTIAVLNAIQGVCMPTARGTTVPAASEPLGYRKERRSEIYTYEVDRYFEIRVLPQGSNQNVCMLEIDYGINQIEPIVVGVHNWAMARGYTLYRNDKFTTDLERHTRSWEKTADGVNEALVLVSMKQPDGDPLSRRADRATVLYSVTPAPAPTPAPAVPVPVPAPAPAPTPAPAAPTPTTPPPAQ